MSEPKSSWKQTSTLSLYRSRRTLGKHLTHGPSLTQDSFVPTVFSKGLIISGYKNLLYHYNLNRTKDIKSQKYLE